MASTSSMSSPGSMTMASRVCSSPTTEQLHCNGPSGKISWIIISSYQTPRFWRNMRQVSCVSARPCAKLRNPSGTQGWNSPQEQSMERISRITFRDHTILLVDCSDCSPEELAAVADDLPRHVTQEPHGSVLLH